MFWILITNLFTELTVHAYSMFTHHETHIAIGKMTISLLQCMHACTVMYILCEKDPVASKGAMPQMFWRGMYLPTCHHNRGSTELNEHRSAVCCFLKFYPVLYMEYRSPIGVIR